ncbi:hypothetical protein GOP47_0024719 [Adiantum capillus-veneris]|uniref:Transmembrane protein n=1 Tax=Adiantum capillus-veneris TaxID=13818 RepID=A0A9D4U4J3_ADICA|nr:hypothetical protein GOP47_0024719 [Adiantum capillus-veneris]
MEEMLDHGEGLLVLLAIVVISCVVLLGLELVRGLWCWLVCLNDLCGGGIRVYAKALSGHMVCLWWQGWVCGGTLLVVFR